jgi:hypothetical protein
MSIIRSTLAGALLVSIPALGLAQEFPQAPPKLKEAEAQGLPRVGTEELKQFMPGKVDSKGAIGRRIKTFKSDGTVDTVGYKGGNPESGTWRFDEANNTYCHTFQGKRNSAEDCFAVFRAADGAHFFDYNVKTGFFEHTWRHIAE